MKNSKIVSIGGLTPEEIADAREAAEVVAEVIYWWNRSERAWVVQKLNAAGHQVGPSEYLGNCGVKAARRFALGLAQVQSTTGDIPVRKD